MKKIIFLLTCLLAMFTYQNVDAQGIHVYKAGKVVTTITAAEFDSLVAFEPIDNELDFEFVDLGLSVKWASCNLGAKFPEDYGDCYAWGETTPKKIFTKENSLTYGKTISDIAGNPQYDAATAIYGKGVRLPTKAEFEELKRNTQMEWTVRNGVKGGLLTSLINGNTIFFPAVGGYDGIPFNGAGEVGNYWSSTPQENDDNNAYLLHVIGWKYVLVTNPRSECHCIRPVQEK